MRVVTLPHCYGTPKSRVGDLEALLPEYIEVYEAAMAGTLCVQFYDGDRTGSIARFTPEGDHKQPALVLKQRRYSSDEDQYIIENDYLGGVVTWDGRKNKVKFNGFMAGNYEGRFVLDYDGPTIWEKFDAKAAKDALLKNPDQRDINGNVLSIGDSVLYINARYGSRMVLDQGKIVEFLVSVNSRGHTFSTVIQNAAGEESNLQYPEDMVYRLD